MLLIVKVEIFEIFGFWDEIFDFDSVNALWKPFQKGKLCIEECLLCQTYLHINIGMDKNSLILSSCLVAMLQWKFRHLTLVNNFSIFTVKKIKETDKNREIKMSFLRSSEKMTYFPDETLWPSVIFLELNFTIKKTKLFKIKWVAKVFHFFHLFI